MKFLKEMWEGINYKGYVIEYNQDALERAIESAKEDGELHFNFSFFVMTKNGQHVYRTKSLKDARNYIDRVAEPRYIAYWDSSLPCKQYMSKYWLDSEARWNELEGTRNPEDVYYDSFIVYDRRDAYAFESKKEAIELLKKYGNDIFAEGEKNTWIADVKFEETYE